MTKQLNKKGTSLVELIAVIIIMGIIAGIAIPTTIAVINRQKQNAANNSAKNVMAAAETVLMEVAANPSDKPNYVLTGSGDQKYTVTVKALADNGELKSNPLEGDNKDTIYIWINANNKCFWSTDTLEINGKTVSVDNGTSGSGSTTTTA